jgi:uncharacterized lipoprotein YbaY/heat shock protein HslJ
MFLKIARIVAALALVIVGELASGQVEGSAVITGTVAYLQRSALAPDAVVKVQLQDVSLQDAPAKIVAEVKVPSAGRQVPIPFRIPYLPANINPAHSYVVRATIAAHGEEMFTSTSAYPVITRGAPTTDVMVMVQPVSARSLGTPPEKAAATKEQCRPRKDDITAKLEGTRWDLIELDGQPLVAAASVPANLFLNADEKKLSGSSGCNVLVGSYKLYRSSLHFMPVGLTKMACPESLMNQEQAFLHALSATTSYCVMSETLALHSGERVLARFKSLDVSSPSTHPAIDPAETNTPADKWLGKWNGPEGTYLLLSKNGNKYGITIQTLDGPETYEGIPTAGGIEFERHGKIESIRAGNGEATGMKWLMGKKNCLLIKYGEGFCRN